MFWQNLFQPCSIFNRRCLSASIIGRKISRLISEPYIEKTEPDICYTDKKITSHLFGHFITLYWRENLATIFWHIYDEKLSRYNRRLLGGDSFHYETFSTDNRGFHQRRYRYTDGFISIGVFPTVQLVTCTVLYSILIL